MAVAPRIKSRPEVGGSLGRGMAGRGERGVIGGNKPRICIQLHVYDGNG